MNHREASIYVLQVLRQLNEFSECTEIPIPHQEHTVRRVDLIGTWTYKRGNVSKKSTTGTELDVVGMKQVQS